MSRRLATISGVALLTACYYYAVAVAAAAGYATGYGGCARTCQEARYVLAAPLLGPATLAAIGLLVLGTALVVIGQRETRGRNALVVRSNRGSR